MSLRSLAAFLPQQYVSIFLALTAGAFLGVAFLHSALWILFVPGLVISFWIIFSRVYARQAFLLGWLIGTVKMLFVISWFWSTFPLTWMQIDAFGSVLVIGVYWSLVSLVIGLGFACSGVLAWYARKRMRPLVTFLLIPIIFCIGELLGAFFFSALLYGEGGSLNASFSYGHLGYLLSEHEFVQIIARFGGVYTLSLGAAALGYSAYFLTERILKRRSGRDRILMAAILSFILCLLGSGFFLQREEEVRVMPVYRVALIGTHFSMEELTTAEERNKTRDALKGALSRALEESPTHIAFPEDAKYTEHREVTDIYQELRAKGGTPMLVDSYTTPQNGNSILRAYIYDSAAETVYEFDKQYLVPQGEYVPLIFRGLFWVAGFGNFFDFRTFGTDLMPGNKRVGEIPADVPEILFCSENIPPYLLSTFRQVREAAFVINPISHSWFHEPHALWNQTEQMTRLLAIQNRAVILQPNNGGPIMAFDSWGKELSPIRTIEQDGVEIKIYEF